MRITKRHLLGLVAALPMAWLTACGGGGDSNNATVRLVNASTGYPSLDFYVHDAAAATGVQYGTGSEYASVKSGEVSNVLTATGSTTELLNQSRTLGSGKKYTVVAFGWESGLRSVIMTDDEKAADTDKTKLSVLNSAIDAGELDVYLTQGDEALSSPVINGVDAGVQTGFSAVASGTYKLTVTGVGDNEDVRLQVDGVVLDSTKVMTLVLTPGKGGVLVHAISVVQDGAVASYVNTQARVRMVAAVSDADAPTFSRVTINADDSGTSDVILGSNVSSFTIKDYVLVNAGQVKIKTSVDGTALTDKTVTLEAGSDTTLLVTGTTAGDATVRVIDDDNRLPTVATKYKIRLIHASPMLQDQNLSMTVDSSDAVSDLAFGTASDFDDRSPPASGQATIELTTPTQGTIYTLTDQTLVAKGVYTVFATQRLTSGVVAPYATLSPSR